MKAIAFYGPFFWNQKERRLPVHTLAVVIDVLRATTTMVFALSSGVKKIYPASQLQEAFLLRDQLSQAKLAGEIQGKRVQGFDFGNSPQEFLTGAPLDFDLVMFTTNGTRAFQATHRAEEVIAASFLNLDSVVEKVRLWEGPVAYFCAGTGEDFSLEDAIVAGAILSQTDSRHPLVSLYQSTKSDLPRAFRQSKNGAHLVRIGLESDIDLSLELNRFSILPYYEARTGIISTKIAPTALGEAPSNPTFGTGSI